MVKVLAIVLLLLTGCGKKGKLYLEGKEDESIIQIDEERIYKF